MGHAWLEHQDKIYDAVHNKTFELVEYLAKYMAKPILRYSRQEALSIGIGHRNFGPWH
jgi:hypothetical protein